MTTKNETTIFSASLNDFTTVRAPAVPCACRRYALPYAGAFLNDSRNVRHTAERCENPNGWKTRAAFRLTPGGGWKWITWTHAHGNKHAAIIEKATEVGAVAWDFSQADHGECGRVNF